MLLPYSMSLFLPFSVLKFTATAIITSSMKKRNHHRRPPQGQLGNSNGQYILHQLPLNYVSWLKSCGLRKNYKFAENISTAYDRHGCCDQRLPVRKSVHSLYYLSAQGKCDKTSQNKKKLPTTIDFINIFYCSSRFVSLISR